MRYEFGKNWDAYERRHLDEENLAITRRYLLHFLKRDDLHGSRFLDIGCGSGMHSLAALRAGAERVWSFDYDPDSVATTRRLWERAGKPDHWTVFQGDALDTTFMQSLEPADIVYSWGVLHHTGDMWKAIRNARLPLRSDGVLYIALYSSDIYVDPTPEYWIQVKQDYNRAGPLRRRWIESKFIFRDTIWPSLRKLRNPLKKIRAYNRRSRGMSYYIDLRDWLGGYPIEFAGNAETVAFAQRELDLEVLQVGAGNGCTEYLFRPRGHGHGSGHYWDAVLAAHPELELKPPFEHAEGLAWQTAMPRAPDADWTRAAMVYEDGIPLGYSQARYKSVRRSGRGRFFIDRDRDTLYFSASDDTDPSFNGRRYTIRAGMGWTSQP